MTFLSGNQFTTYNYIDSFEPVAIPSPVNFRWSKVFINIDSAMVIDDVIYFTSNSFYQTAPSAGGNASALKLIQDNWFKCDDDQYRPMNKTWNVTNFEQFKQFKSHYKPKVNDTYQLDQRPRTESANSGIFIAIIIMLIVLILTVLIAIIIHIWKLKKLKTFSSREVIGTPIRSDVVVNENQQKKQVNSTIGLTVEVPDSNTVTDKPAVHTSDVQSAAIKLSHQ